MNPVVRVVCVLLFVATALACRGQAPACGEYQRCLANSCEDCTPIADDSLIGLGGDCWTGTVEEAENCESGCLTALEDACRDYDDEACCAEPEHVYVP